MMEVSTVISSDAFALFRSACDELLIGGLLLLADMHTPKRGRIALLDLWLLVCGLIVLGMAIHRADVASFTHDESYSYMYYPRMTVAEIMQHTEAFTNNHLLNSLGMKLGEQWFGASELALRAPNLLALVLYLAYGALFLRGLPVVACALGYPLLISNPYVMEFFTLARGYGLSFGFLLAALFHLHRAIATRRVAHLVLFHVACILASLANFTLLGTHVAGILTWYIGTWWRSAPGDPLRNVLIKGTAVNLVMCVLTWIILAGPVSNVLATNALDFGGKGDLYQTTVLTWARSMVSGVPMDGFLVKLLQAVIVLVAIVAVIVLIKHRRRVGTEPFGTSLALFVVTSMLLLSCFGAELQHLLFGVDRLVDRFALFLVPLVLLLFITVLAMATKGWLRVGAGLLLVIASTYSVRSFAIGFGPYRSVEWQYNVNAKEAVQAVLRDIGTHPLGHLPATVGGNWMLEPSWNYYQRTQYPDSLAPWERNGPHDEVDYRLQLANDPPEENIGYRQIARFPESGCSVLRRIVVVDQQAGH
jgi:hypothetical protein